MSSIGYRGLLYEVSQNLKDSRKINQILYTARSEGLIAEDSESYNAQVNPGDNSGVVVMQLFSDLQKQDNLGIDNLEILRDLLKGVKKWSLIDEVDKFAKQRKDFVTLSNKIIGKFDERDNLDELIELCADHIPDDVKEDIKDVRTLFSELEKKNRLGFGRLALLKKILNETGEEDLLDDLIMFEKKWKEEEDAERRRDQVSEAVKTVLVAPASLYSTIKHAAEQMIGALKVFCKFSTVSGISLAVGTGIILRQGSRASLKEFVDAFKEAVLPAAAELRAISESSVCFTVQAENTGALKELWERYQDGTLQSNLQEFLVTDDIKQLADGEDVTLTVHVDEQEFNDACFSFIVAEKQVLYKEDQEMPAKRPRRNSDSVVLVRSRENAAMRFYANLRQAETKFQEKKESVEKEKEKRRSQLEDSRSHAEEASTSEQTTESRSEAKYMSWRRKEGIQERPGFKRFTPAATTEFETEEIRAQEFEMLERPGKRRRRNSDSDLYYKAKDVEMSERERNREPFLGEEKYAFVQRYLENLQERQSLTTETSDSGIKTHGATSELGMEDISESVQKFCYRDLSIDVTNELTRSTEADSETTRLILQSFGITAGAVKRFPIDVIAHTFNRFPDTPVKLLKDIFEALQLYDLVELLEKPAKPLAQTRSLRPALSLEEIRKLRNTAGRPTSYHSRAAVLIFAKDTQDSSVKGMETFFKGLNLTSRVTVIQYRARGAFTVQQKSNPLPLQPKIQAEIRRINKQLKTETEHDAIITLRRKLRFKMEFLDSVQKALENLKGDKIVLRAALTVIDEWIQMLQGEFSFFAVFDAAGFQFFSDVIGKLESGIPNKTKFVLGSSRQPRISEALQVSGNFLSFPLLVEILNKRWQTLDLVAMVRELRRRNHVTSLSAFVPSIQDTLSSLPRFKRAEDLS